MCEFTGVKPACAMKVTAGISHAPATDQSIVRGLSMSISVEFSKCGQHDMGIWNFGRAAITTRH